MTISYHDYLAVLAGRHEVKMGVVIIIILKLFSRYVRNLYCAYFSQNSAGALDVHVLMCSLVSPYHQSPYKCDKIDHKQLFSRAELSTTELPSWMNGNAGDQTCKRLHSSRIQSC